MNTEDTIGQHSNLPVSDSIEPIIKSLATRLVFVGTEDVTPTKDGKITGKIRLKTGRDNQGRFWAYAYTSQAEFDKAFPKGGPFAEMKFRDVFKIIESDQRFGGMYLNSASATSYPIPREMFGHVNRVLLKEADESQLP